MSVIIDFISNKYQKLLEKDQSGFHAMAHEIIDSYEKNQDIPFVKEMCIVMQPMVEGMDKEFAGKGESIKERKEKVLNVSDVFDTLNEVQMHKWVVAVEQHFLKTTAEFKSIFSKGEYVFNKGSREKKIGELKAMINMVRHYPVLQSVAEDMEAFCKKMELAVSIRHQSDSAIKKNIINTSEIAEQLAVELYANQGEFMKQYKTDPEKILQFIPVRYFKRKHKKNNGNDEKPLP